MAFKVVVLGDGAVGKTSMLLSFTDGAFPEGANVSNQYGSGREEREPPINLTVDDLPVTLDLWDVAGQGDYDRLRQLFYSDTDVFLACYSVTSSDSLSNLSQMWYPELVHHSPGTPIVLVGIKSDLRDQKENGGDALTLVSQEEVDTVGRVMGVFSAVECSALTQKGLAAVFEEAARAVLHHRNPPRKKNNCSIM